jgi:hypothetical protein
MMICPPCSIPSANQFCHPSSAAKEVKEERAEAMKATATKARWRRFMMGKEQQERCVRWISIVRATCLRKVKQKSVFNGIKTRK